GTPIATASVKILSTAAVCDCAALYRDAKSTTTVAGWTLSDGLVRIRVGKSSSHYHSQNDIGGDNACSQHLSGSAPVSDYRCGFKRSAQQKIMRPTGPLAALALGSPVYFY